MTKKYQNKTRRGEKTVFVKIKTHYSRFAVLSMQNTNPLRNIKTKFVFRHVWCTAANELELGNSRKKTGLVHTRARIHIDGAKKIIIETGGKRFRLMRVQIFF